MKKVGMVCALCTTIACCLRQASASRSRRRDSEVFKAFDAGAVGFVPGTMVWVLGLAAGCAVVCSKTDI